MLTRFEAKIRSLEEWHRLREDWPRLFDPITADEIVESIARNGLTDPFTGYIDGAGVRIESKNYWETIIAAGLNSRQRAAILVLRELMRGRHPPTSVYASEAVSPLGRQLKTHLADCVCSEYLPTSKERKEFPDVLHQDIMNMSFRDESFDIYLSCDVLEHVPDLFRSIREAWRIVKPGGVFMGTVPFAAGKRKTVVRAKLDDGEIVHLMEPLFHDNPTRPEEGSLVFHIPAWDFFSLCREAGFEDAYMHLILSRAHGVISTDPSAFVMVFVATKA